MRKRPKLRTAEVQPEQEQGSLHGTDYCEKPSGALRVFAEAQVVDSRCSRTRFYLWSMPDDELVIVNATCFGLELVQHFGQR